jgi:hypothetical protein
LFEGILAIIDKSNSRQLTRNPDGYSLDILADLLDKYFEATSANIIS